jgi:hypothetical protein
VLQRIAQGDGGGIARRLCRRLAAAQKGKKEKKDEKVSQTNVQGAVGVCVGQYTHVTGEKQDGSHGYSP